MTNSFDITSYAYASMSGMLWVQADNLRDDLIKALEFVPDSETYLRDRIKDTLDRTAHVAEPFNVKFEEIRDRMEAESEYSDEESLDDIADRENRILDAQERRS